MIKTTVFSNPASHIGLTLALVAALIFPVFSYAATYEYVNTSGTVSSVSASSAEVALQIAPNLALHSGVILAQGTSNVVPVQFVPGQSTQYGYINSSGVFTIVTANTSTGAFTNSINISEHSGVMVLNSQADRNMVGDLTVL